ncbi:hypothetical protein ACFX13_000382 [Malus domestica]
MAVLVSLTGETQFIQCVCSCSKGSLKLPLEAQQWLSSQLRNHSPGTPATLTPWIWPFSFVGFLQMG